MKMVLNILESLKTENFQKKELLHIKMEQHILVNSSKANSMDKELTQR